MLLDTPDAKVIIDLPFSPYLMPEGTIEFWAKLPQPHQQFGSGRGHPWLFNMECPELNYTHHFVFGFNPNDGAGGGGLVGGIHGIGRMATHRWGTAATIAETGLLGDTPDGWHHYAFVWKRDGINFPEAPGRVILLIVDRKVAATSVYSPNTNFVDTRETEGKKIRLVVHDVNSDNTRPVAMSDLKIWDHAKLPQPDF